MKDANSIISKEGATNALAVATAASGETESPSPPLTPTSKNDFQNSIRIWQLQASDSTTVPAAEAEEEVEDENGFLRRTFTNLASSPMFGGNPRASIDGARSSSEEQATESPKIIAYRKPSHKRTNSDSLAFWDEHQKFDPKYYVEEKFKETKYRYTTIQRNINFHLLFRSMDLTDRLLDDFACALSREILLQGRIYITEHSVCFNSNLLGWVTSLVVPFEDITRIDKKSTAGLFPNGIAIETKEVTHYFASFLSRDATYEFIRTVWQASTGKEFSDLDSVPLDTPDKAKGAQAAERKISSYLMTLDGDDNSNDALWGKEEDEIDDDFSSEENSSDYDEEEDVVQANGTVPLEETGKTLQLRPESKYKNKGPEFHVPTTVSQEFSDAKYEKELCSELIEAPMGIVFDIVFGSNNTSFQRRFLKEHDASEITEYDKFVPMEDDPTKLERKYQYRRELGYSIGPKSTKCLVSEVIEHLNFADYIVVTSTTATPDVPSGGSFTVKTRYYFTWGENNTTMLRIAYFVKWTGRSWVKNIVENLTLAAQEKVTVEFLKELNKEIVQHTHIALGPVAETVAVVETPKPAKPAKKKKTPKAMPRRAFFSGNLMLVLGCYLVLFMLFMLVLVQLRLASTMIETRELMQKQLALTTTLLGVLQSLDINELVLDTQKDAFWLLVNQREGRALSKSEQAAYLAHQALLLLGEHDAEQPHDRLLKEILISLF